MANLLDIAPSTACEVVKIRDTRIVVRGLRAKGLAPIVARYPEMVGLLLGGLAVEDITSRFIRQFGDAVAPMIAAGCGHSGDQDYERFAENELLLEDQMRLVVPIIRLTFPNGFGFFAEMLVKLAGVGEEAKTKPIKVRLKKSPSPSQPSFDGASRQIM